MLEPLKNVQVWRFSLYYFFVFGGFVSLALWLPRYLIGVYGVGIAAAGVIGAAYSIPASIFRAYGGHLPTSSAPAGDVLDVSGVRSVCTFILSYPPTQYVMQGSRGPIAFSTHLGVVGVHGHRVRARLLHEPGQGGGVQAHPGLLPRSGRRGRRRGRLVGGLGGFAMPIAFGALNDLTGIWQSCFWLLFALVAHRAGVDACGGPADGAHGAGAGRRGLDAAGTPGNAAGPCTGTARGAVAALVPSRTGGLRMPSSGVHGPQDRPAQPVDLGPCLLLSFAVWMVWSVVVAKLPAVGFAFTNEQLFWLAALPGLSGATLRVVYAFMPAMFGGRLWTTLTTWSLLIPAVGMGFAVQNPTSPYWIFLVLALLCGLGGGNFASSMANISFFFPEGREGQCAGHQRGPRQSRRQRRAVRRAAGDYRGRLRLAGGEPQTATQAERHDDAVAAKRRVRVRAVHRRQRLRAPGSA